MNEGLNDFRQVDRQTSPRVVQTDVNTYQRHLILVFLLFYLKTVVSLQKILYQFFFFLFLFIPLPQGLCKANQITQLLYELVIA